MAMKNIAIVIYVLASCTAISIRAQSLNPQQRIDLSSIPGAQTAAGFMASASDETSRYLAPNDPIQPTISAISRVPMRAGELANEGITSINFDRGAQGITRAAAGQNGQIRMQELDTATSMMPASVANLGDSLHGMVRAKNNFIRGQAERGIEAANRMGESMRQGLQMRSSGPMLMGHASSMVGQVQDMMVKSGHQLEGQLKQSIQGTMGRLQSVQGMGSEIVNQATGYGRTLSQGVQGAAGQLRQTGQQLMSQAQQNHNKNMSAMGNMLGSLHGSMSQMGQNMQNNLGGLSRQASNVAQQLTSSLQTVAQAPLNMIQSLGSGLMKGGHTASNAGRY